MLAIVFGGLLSAEPLHAGTALKPDAPPDPALAGTLEKLVREATSTGMDVGLLVRDLQTGQVLYEHRADKSYNPASVTKVITTAVALRELGPGFTFRTEVLRSGSLSGGVLAGDLVVRGEGDPSITLERLWRIASLIGVAGVKRIDGDIVVDDGYFDDVRRGQGYDDFDEDRAYTAPVGAVSATWNTVAVVVRPGARAGAPAEVALDPPTSFVTLDSRATTSRSGRRRIAVSIDGRTIRVRGSMPLGAREKVYYRPVDDPPAYFGTLLKEYLAKEGITVGGKVVRGRTPEKAVALFEYDSEPLGVIVRDLNKLSNNFTAEQILKAMGAHEHGAPGTSEKGMTVIRAHLAGLGLDPSSFTMKNGSGLARDNAISPRLFVKVLEDAWSDFAVRGDFIASMGIAGEDGTMRSRMVGLPGERNVLGKTGTVDGSTCLAGYAQSANGHPLAFAILMNGVQGRTRRAMQIQDKIGSALAAWEGALDGSLAGGETPSTTNRLPPETKSK